ncbi:MAG: RNA-binding protein [Xanthomonadales bacterium]|nr:RNA-binding protein [Xanthomonadales bacterium]
MSVIAARNHNDDDESVRVDIWLWAARFFKTRRLCREAIDGGKIELNGAACKPAKTLHAGAHLRIRRGEQRLDVEVLAVSSQRGPASVAQALYQETAASIAARAAQQEQQRLIGMAGPSRKPDKQARRQLRRVKHGG